MAKKYYAIRGEHKSEIFTAWSDVQEQIKNHKADYGKLQQKSFPTREQALEYIEEGVGSQSTASTVTKGSETSQDNLAKLNVLLGRKDKVYAFVDGSYSENHDRVGYGTVIVAYDKNGEPFIVNELSGHLVSKDHNQQRQIAGEFMGAHQALRYANEHNIDNLVIVYDYVGVEKFVTGEWKPKAILSQQYRNAMQALQQTTPVSFVKVPAHVTQAVHAEVPMLRFNERADHLAYAGATNEA